MARKKQKKMNRTNRNTVDRGPDARGDIPKRRECSIETLSIRPPRTTQQCTFHHVTEATDLVCSNAAAVTAQYNFQLSSLDIASAVGAVWDQYRIEAIRFSILPDNNANPIEPHGNTTLVQLYCVIDYDDSSALGSANAAKRYDNCAVVEPAESLCRTFQPRVATATYSGAFTSFANEGPLWIDMASQSVQHYGVKVYIPACTAAQTNVQSWKVEIEYWVSYRSVF